jgi:hypothetical protein
MANTLPNSAGRRRPFGDEEELPPFISGVAGRHREEPADAVNPGIAKIASDTRALLALPLLVPLMVAMPQSSPLERANLAWDEVDALLTVRKERRTQHIQGLKDRGEFRPRGGGDL